MWISIPFPRLSMLVEYIPTPAPREDAALWLIDFLVATPRGNSLLYKIKIYFHGLESVCLRYIPVPSKSNTIDNFDVEYMVRNMSIALPPSISVGAPSTLFLYPETKKPVPKSEIFVVTSLDNLEYPTPRTDAKVMEKVYKHGAIY